MDRACFDDLNGATDVQEQQDKIHETVEGLFGWTLSFLLGYSGESHRLRQ